MQISRVPLTALALLVLSAAGAAPQIGSSPASPTSPTGTTGASGSTATAEGPSGSSGVSGASGATGSSGASGASGASGSSGASGLSGPTGTSGASSSTGASGTTSSTGASGQTGTSAAATGTTAQTGPTGATTSTTGATGTTAQTGPTGSTGPSAPPSIASISAQPTSGSQLLSGGGGGRSESGGALAPAPNPDLFSQSNPLAGVLPGSLLDPLVDTALGTDVPEFYVEHFDVPAFLLPIYQSAAAAYDVPWEVLAAINEVETNYGSDLNVSSAGAEGWMQFLPSTWKRYDVDASDTGAADPYNAADAIFAAARYLAAAGAATNLTAAIYAYNHSDAYVQSVLLRAELLSGVPTALVQSVSEIADGDFPVELRDHPSYSSSAAKSTSTESTQSTGSKAPAPSAVGAAVKSATVGHAPTSAKVFASPHAAAVAVTAGTIVAIGHSRRLGTYIRLEDAFGNTYTYGNLGSTAAYHLVAKPRSSAATGSLATPDQLASGPAPTAPASAGDQQSGDGAKQTAAQLKARRLASFATGSHQGEGLQFASAHGADTLIFAPLSIRAAPPATEHAAARAIKPSLERRLVDRYFTTAFGLPRKRLEARPLRVGSQVLAGTILGYLGKGNVGTKPHLLFELRPAGTGQRLVDPRPFLDAWSELATLELHRKAIGQPLYGPNADASDAGVALRMSQVDLERLILGDKALKLTRCERQAIAAGNVDRRVLATVEFLVDRGLAPTIAGCTSTATDAAITTADSVKITGLDGAAIAGHTGAGTPADTAVRALASLTGENAPSEITSFETIAGAANTSASTTDPDAIVVSFTPQSDPLAPAQTASYTGSFNLGPTRWAQLDAHLLTITQPRVPTVISSVAVRTPAKPKPGPTPGP